VPVPSGTAIRVYRHVSQDVCPWNQRFASENREPAFAPREVLADKDARQLARDLLGMTQEEFSRAFKGSPMKRAKLRGLKRNAALVLGNVGTSEDVDALMRALDDPEALVREHAAWALARLATSPATYPPALPAPAPR
jgi:epoxyqueuosine reductase QueG